MSQNGKGSKPRPISKRSDYYNNWDSIKWSSPKKSSTILLSFDEYIEFPMSEYDKTIFNKLQTLLGSIEKIENAFELTFPENELGLEVCNKPPVLWDEIEPLTIGKGHRFTIKSVRDQLIFFINEKERTRRSVED
jgi:hypothetical protein